MNSPNLNKLLAVISVLGSAASVIGLVALYAGPHGPATDQAWRIVFWLSLSICLYILLVPGNQVVANIASKLGEYDTELSLSDGQPLVLQKGEIRLYHRGTVVFEFPFAQPPEIELINIEAVADKYLPTARNITRFQFEIVRKDCPTTEDGKYYSVGKFGWISTGKLLRPAGSQ